MNFPFVLIYAQFFKQYERLFSERPIEIMKSWTSFLHQLAIWNCWLDPDKFTNPFRRFDVINSLVYKLITGDKYAKTKMRRLLIKINLFRTNQLPF